MHHGDLIKNISEIYNIEVKKFLVQKKTWGNTCKINLTLYNGKQLFFKEKASNISYSEANFRQCVQNVLSSRNYQIPKLIEDTKGGYINSYNELIYEIQECVGSGSKQKKRDYAEIGRALGQLHNDLNMVYSKFHPKCREIYYPSNFKEFLDNTVKFIDFELNKKELNFFQFIPKKEIKLVWEYINEKFTEKQLIHGDFHENNIIYDNELKIIDLDDLRYDIKLRDISWFLGIKSFIAYKQDDYLGKLKNNFSQVLVNDFIEGYNEKIQHFPCHQKDIFKLLSIDIFVIFVNCTGLDDFEYNGEIEEDMILLKKIFNFLIQKGK